MQLIIQLTILALAKFHKILLQQNMKTHTDSSITQLKRKRQESKINKYRNIPGTHHQ